MDSCAASGYGGDSAIRRVWWQDGFLEAAWEFSLAVRAGPAGFNSRECLSGMRVRAQSLLAKRDWNQQDFQDAYPELAPYYPIGSTNMWMDPWLVQDYHGYWW